MRCMSRCYWQLVLTLVCAVTAVRISCSMPYNVGYAGCMTNAMRVGSGMN
jgi:hypothetical protein